MKSAQPRYYPGQPGRIDSGTSVPDEEIPVPAGLLAKALAELDRVKDDLARQAASKDRIVDEYQPQSLAQDTTSSITLLPQFERLWERIERVIITGPTQNTPGLSFEGSVTSPGASGVILTIPAGTIPNGNYTLNITIQYTGTISATDTNNVKLQNAGNTIVAAFETGATVGEYPQQAFQLQGYTGGALSFRSIAAATVGAVYTVYVDVVPNGGFPVTLQLGDRVWNLTIPATGLLNISTTCMLLSPQMVRQLTATFPGEYSLELLGYADVRNAPY